MDRAKAIAVLMAQMLVLGKGYPSYREAMEMAIAALREQDATDINVGNKWISVEERLPKHGKIVLCNTKWFCEVLQWDEKGNVWCGKDRVYSASYVTHWMPLPEPPKEGAEG